MLSDSTRTDTAALGFLGAATAQVKVSLPLADEDDLADDDVIGDEVEPIEGELEDADEVDDAALDDADLDDVPVEAVGEESVEVSATAEPLVDAASADAARVEAEAVGAEAVEAENVDDTAEVEVVDAELEPAAGDERVDDVSEDLPEAITDDADILDDHSAPVAGGAAEAEPIDDAERDAAAAASASAASLSTDVSESVPEPAAVGTVASDATRALAQVAAAAEEDAAVDETRAERAHAVERVRTRRPEVTLASKRLDQFEVDKESSDLLTPDRLLEPGRLGRPEPEGAWQHLVYSLSGGRINLGDGKRARARKELAGRIAAPLAGGARFVPVLSRKGGVGKTTVTTLLGMALADARDDRVIAIDANPDRGTLAERISRHNGKTVRDLVRMKDSVTGYNDVSTIVARDETRLDVLASDADPQVSVAFSDADYEDVAKLAAHYYSIVLTDTGTGIVHSVMGATLGLADQLVIVAGLSVDEARLASETLTWLETNGYAAKSRNAVVVLNNARPGAPLVREDELEAHFRTRVRQVVRMPYDAAIGTGSAIVFHDLQPETRQAARTLAAAVVEGLRQLAAAA